MHANWVQKSLENATWDPFGTKSRRARKSTTPKSTFWAENVGPRAAYGSDLDLKWLPKRDFDARLALGPSKN